MQPRTRGATPTGFRAQLLQLLRNQAHQVKCTPQILQQRIAFERLLARFPSDGEWVLNGGFALQLRYGLQARPTRDVDLLTTYKAPDELDRLRHMVSVSPEIDRFTFEFGEVVQELQGAPGGTQRVRITARVAGEPFCSFQLDLSSGDALVGATDLLTGLDLLKFAGVPPIRFPVYPVEQHLAEKLHAYTLPRPQENTRVKDLVDLIITESSESVEVNRLGPSVEATFEVRATHTIPPCLPPPSTWSTAFASMASWAGGLATTITLMSA